MGLYASKIGAHTGSSCFFVSYAKPIVGEWELATAPMIFAMRSTPYKFESLRLYQTHGDFSAVGDRRKAAKLKTKNELRAKAGLRCAFGTPERLPAHRIDSQQ